MAIMTTLPTARASRCVRLTLDGGGEAALCVKVPSAGRKFEGFVNRRAVQLLSGRKGGHSAKTLRRYEISSPKLIQVLYRHQFQCQDLFLHRDLFLHQDLFLYQHPKWVPQITIRDAPGSRRLRSSGSLVTICSPLRRAQITT